MKMNKNLCFLLTLVFSGAALADGMLIAGSTGTAIVPVAVDSSGNIGVNSTASDVYLASIDGKIPTVGQKAAASSSPVTLSDENVQDLYVAGQSAQTATVNNILTATSGTAATDLTGYRSGLVQVVSTGSGGTYIFEGSNDNTNFQTIPVFSQLILTGTPITAAITATSSSLGYTFPVQFRYIRLRIATTITGGSIRAFSKFSQTSWTPAILQVAQATGANLNAAISSLPTLTTVTTVGTVTTLANGQTGNSSASTGSPVRAGGRVKTTNDTTLVSGDAADVATTTDNATITFPFAAPELNWQYAAAASGIVSSTAGVTMKAAAGAGLRNYITGCQVAHATLGGVTELVIRDGASGTVIWRMTLNIVANENIDVNFGTPLKGTAATLLEVATLTSVTGGVYVNCQGFVAP
jgi:hypothetical protein